VGQGELRGLLVDLHTHILPGLDDGAPDETTALEMCRMAARNGTRELVATPKTTLAYPFEPGEIDERIRALQDQLGDKIFLHRGADLRLSWSNLAAAFEDPGRYTINGGRYLLMEIGEDVLTRGATKVIERFQALGVTPILAQPERDRVLMRDLSRLRRWTKRGCLAQISAGSLTGVFGEETQLAAIRLLNGRLAHIVASDAHNTRSRSTNLTPAYDYVTYRWGSHRAKRLFVDNPWSVLWSEPIEHAGSTRRHSRGWFSKLGLNRSQKKRSRRRG